jgi:protein-S-isoprenylcysteine O-methyltransferase Ste14
MDFLGIFPFISFVFFSLILTGRIIYLRRKGIRVSSNTGDKPWYLALIYPVFGLLFLLWIAELMNMALHLKVFFLPDWCTQKLYGNTVLEISGMILVLIALFLWVLTLFHFKYSLRFGLDERNAGDLITTGVFAFTRNPFFLSVNLFFTGLALLHPSLFFIIMALLTIISIHFFILKEEKFLRKHYGEAYRIYSERVGRYF